jgi:hypothetical protein
LAADFGQTAVQGKGNFTADRSQGILTADFAEWADQGKGSESARSQCQRVEVNALHLEPK